MARRAPSHRSVMPGFRLAAGFTALYVLLLLILPLTGLVAQTASLSWAQFWHAAASPRALASYRLSFGTAASAAALNAAFGLLVAWVLVRYRFPGRVLADALVDLPLALPTAVAGLTLTGLYAEGGWFGALLRPLGVKAAFTPAGVVLALTFVGLPFVVRSVQPVLEGMERDVEESAAMLGASRYQTFRWVILPSLVPALITGSALAFARALGEYGSVVFISGNVPMKTEIVPLLIITRLEQYDYAGATALAAVMLGASFALMLLINQLQRRAAMKSGHGRENGR